MTEVAVWRLAVFPAAMLDRVWLDAVWMDASGEAGRTDAPVDAGRAEGM
jgi:hypothetical protein